MYFLLPSAAVNQKFTVAHAFSSAPSGAAVVVLQGGVVARSGVLFCRAHFDTLKRFEPHIAVT